MKRLIDLGVAATLLFLMLPVLAIVALFVKIFLDSPVLFTQIRPGLHNKPFKIYKFRTMLGETKKNGEILTEKERLTKFGRILRSTSLDELPELWNVLSGDMSLVGPRPLLMQYVPLYNAHQNRRSEVRPGITGWAQINGRNAISWQQKFDLDIWYVDNRTNSIDFKILFLTAKKVLIREGISSTEDTSMEEFRGNAVKQNTPN